LRYRDLEETVLKKTCRQCINEQYGLRLRRKDCLYFYYPSPCSCCGEIRNIVTEISARGRWKLLLAGRPQEKD